MIFNIHYNAKTGVIDSYQEGPEQTPVEELPPGCKLLAFQSYIHIFDGKVGDTNGRVLMKVDLDKLELVPINPPPKPINL